MRQRIPIFSLDDPQIANYRDVKDRELAVMSNDLFMVESEQLVGAGCWRARLGVESVLVTAKLADEIAAGAGGHSSLCRGGRSGESNHRVQVSLRHDGDRATRTIADAWPT